MDKLNFIWSLPRVYKRIITLLIDVIFILLSFYGAYWTRIGQISNPSAASNEYVAGFSNNHYVIGFGLVFTLLVFSRLGLYRAILRYLTFHALAVVSVGSMLSALSISVLAFYLDASLPRSVPIIYGAFLCLLCGGSRLVVRTLIAGSNKTYKKKVLIYGAGSAGRQLALALRSSDTHKVVGFIDVDRALENAVIMGLPVGNVEFAKCVVDKKHVSQILLAVPSASRTVRKQILGSLVHLSVEVLTIPDMKDIVEGRANIDELMDVEVEDLLGRDSVPPVQSLMQSNIKSKVVMVTGAGGSIGSELCRQIIQLGPKVLVLFELSEFALYKIDRELSQLIAEGNLHIELAPLLGSVQGANRLERTMRGFQVQTCLLYTSPSPRD